MPRIGCGLAGGDWPVIEGLIRATLGSRDIKVTVHELTPARSTSSQEGQIPRISRRGPH
jgi:hypothetical protein